MAINLFELFGRFLNRVTHPFAIGQVPSVPPTTLSSVEEVQSRDEWQRRALSTRGHPGALIMDIFRLPLWKQCERLQIPLTRLIVPETRPAEATALRHFEAQGYVGVAREGAPIVLLLNALCCDTQCPAPLNCPTAEV